MTILICNGEAVSSLVAEQVQSLVSKDSLVLPLLRIFWLLGDADVCIRTTDVSV
jgi:hypothetical protein